MTKPSKNILLAVVMACIVGSGFFLTRQREVVGQDQIGVVVSPGGKISVYPAGARPLVVPFIQHYVRLTAKPIRYELTDGKSLIVTGRNQQELKVGCQVRYQVGDAAKLVAAQGTTSPQEATEAIIYKHLQDKFSTTLQQEGSSLDDVQTRVILVASTHESLKQALAPLGINLISFDLFSW